MQHKLLPTFVGLAAIALLVAVPVVLVPISFSNVPARAELKVVVRFEEAVRTVETMVAAHRHPENAPGRLVALPTDSKGWIELINPMGRKAPGGGLAFKPQSDTETGAIGIMGDAQQVTLSRPRFGDLDPLVHTVTLPSTSTH